VLIVLAAAWTARADDLTPDSGGLRVAADSRMSFSPQPLARVEDAAPSETGLDLSRAGALDTAPPARFGEMGSRWWTIGGGVAYDFHSAWDFNVLRVGFSQFLVDDVEFQVELNAWYFDQSGKDAVGINPAMLFRWHFIDTGKWTVYGDIGIGVLFASSPVPSGGTQFDLMPKIGMGVTYQITDSGVRLQAGVRWHHVSNARIEGDERNPARDAAMIYGAVVFPF
jgi:Lipid A 3-O-deacylase (PagL)